MRNERRLGRFFDDCAARALMVEFEPAEKARMKRLLRRWRIRRGWRILEPGCGAGRLTERLARAVGPQGSVVAFDLSELMTRRAAQRGLPPNTLVLRASAHFLPVRKGSFDAAICFHVFPHFEDPGRALAEMARALKPGGSLRVEHLKSRAAVNRLHRDGGQEIRTHRIPPARTMKRLLQAAGFRLKRLQDGPEGYSLHAVRQQAVWAERTSSKHGYLSRPHGRRTR